MKKTRKFKGYSQNRSLNYKLVTKNISKKRLKEIGDKHASHRIVKDGKEYGLYVWK